MLSPGEIRIKNIDVLEGIFERNYHPALINIVLWVAAKYGIIITESYRIKKHRSDLHGVLPVRAIDCRDREYENPRSIVNDINQNWKYDSRRPEKKCCVWHGDGLNKHFHIQVHPHTRRVGV